MPWFAVDDGFDSHPKVRKAGNAAAGLFCRLGAFSAKHSTNGCIDGVVARGYGTTAQLAKLVAVGMLHDAPHGCDPKRCPQPPEDGYALHDYLFYNRSKSQVEAAREAGRKRQQKGRNAQKQDRTEAQPDLTRDSGETHPSSGWDPVDPQNESRSEGSAAGHEGSSRRDTLQGATVVPSPPLPSPVPSFGRNGAAAERPAAYPDRLVDLKAAIANAGIAGIGWALRESQWEHTRLAVDRVGIPAMVAYAINSARLKGVPATAAAWVDGWRSLEAPAQQDGVTYLPAVIGLPEAPKSRQQQQTDDMFTRAMARAQNLMQEPS
ncbi:hypothetical protein ACFC1T_27315 [Kitasatospora sp. NPDC056076]|uniref:hypothetical protein n=1 Tax=Kitasatospora sp. NPDC056076 TaxID=3345703 RepID=UPI0035D668AF